MDSILNPMLNRAIQVDFGKMDEWSESRLPVTNRFQAAQGLLPWLNPSYFVVGAPLF